MVVQFLLEVLFYEKTLFGTRTLYASPTVICLFLQQKTKAVFGRGRQCSRRWTVG